MTVKMPDPTVAAIAHAPAERGVPPAAPEPMATLPQLLEQLMQMARTSALEEMASGFAHELNQPIAAITTFAQTGKRMLELPSPMIREARDVLHHVSEEALKTGQGIHRIRSVFCGRPVQKTLCSLGEVLMELEPVLEFLAERAHARLQLQVAAPLPLTLLDKLRVQHVIFTLVQNALEAPGETQARKVEIEVNGDRYAVGMAIRDHGLGVPVNIHEHLFRPFFTTKPNGTGLGLASMRAIVDAHEGTVGFENAEGGGARFWFKLPVIQERV